MQILRKRTKNSVQDNVLQCTSHFRRALLESLPKSYGNIRQKESRGSVAMGVLGGLVRAKRCTKCSLGGEKDHKIFAIGETDVKVARKEHACLFVAYGARSEERRVGKECRSRWSP